MPSKIDKHNFPLFSGDSMSQTRLPGWSKNMESVQPNDLPADLISIGFCMNRLGMLDYSSRRAGTSTRDLTRLSESRKIHTSPFARINTVTLAADRKETGV